MESKTESNEIKLDLKFCERCGGLWLRRVGRQRVYCRVCEAAMAELPQRGLKAMGAEEEGEQKRKEVVH